MSLLMPSPFEQHYSIRELAALWKVSRETVRLLILDEPGIVRIQLGRKKALCRYSVPQSVAERIYRKLTAQVGVRSIAA